MLHLLQAASSLVVSYGEAGSPGTPQGLALTLSLLLLLQAASSLVVPYGEAGSPGTPQGLALHVPGEQVYNYGKYELSYNVTISW